MTFSGRYPAGNVEAGGRWGMVKISQAPPQRVPPSHDGFEKQSKGRLFYQSQSMSASDRAFHQMGKICKRLDPHFNGAPDELPDKPSGMHWRTYDRLADHHADIQHQREAEFLSSPLWRRFTALL